MSMCCPGGRSGWLEGGAGRFAPVSETGNPNTPEDDEAQEQVALADQEATSDNPDVDEE